MNTMKVLITGANGQLGRDIQKICRHNSIDFVAAGSNEVDISDLNSVRKFTGKHHVDIIINCAAYNAVDLAETYWKRAFLVNGLGVRNLALAANQLGALLVHFSTDYVFDGSSKRPYTLADTPRPVNRYGESKLLGESCVRDLAERYLLIRTSWVFGPGKDNFIRKIIKGSSEHKELKVVTDQVSSPTYTNDLAHATLDLIRKQAYGTYHITNSGYCSRYEWAAHILDQVGWNGCLIPATSDEFSSAAARPAFSVLDNFGTEETIGYALPDWKDATNRFLEEPELI
jgi:dTDP-4-dehydrorhamnose reductase